MARENINPAWVDVFEALDTRELSLLVLTLLVDKKIFTQEEANNLVSQSLWTTSDKHIGIPIRPDVTVKGGKIEITKPKEEKLK